MATDVIFFLKSPAPKQINDLKWSTPIKTVVIDPPESLKCGGADKLCSTAYSNTWQYFRGADGRVLPNLLKHYVPGLDVGRVAFVGFSAAHGFLNPYANNDADRAGTDSFLMLDSVFGGGKTGYQKFARDAIRGDKMLVTSTSNTGGDDSWRQFVLDPVVAQTAAVPVRIGAKSPMPEPSGGAWRVGSRLYYYRFVDAKNGTELPHWEMHKVLMPMIEAYLLPRWNGSIWPYAIAGGLLAGGVAWWLNRKKHS